MAYDIIVLNVKNSVPQGYQPVEVFRPWPLCIPFSPNVQNDDREREATVIKYKQYLWLQIQKQDGPIFKVMHRLTQQANDIALICHCNQKPCHGDVIKSAIEYLRINRHLLPAAWAPKK